MNIPFTSYAGPSTRGLFAALTALLLAGTAPSRAQVTSALAYFNNANGANPYGGLVLSADGRTLYGTTEFGGVQHDGTVFSVSVSSGAITDLASFNSGNGSTPYAGLTLIGSTLYGTTSAGGANGDGTVFSLPVGGGTPTVLASFNGTNGSTPYASLTRIGSTLYGTTSAGGANSDGTVFSVPVGGGTPTVLASFNGTNGSTPYAGLTLSTDGTTFYGTTINGGANNKGAVFSVPVAGGTPTVLTSFNSTNGSAPYGSLTLSADGTTLYGTTAAGGANFDGTVFSLPVAGGTPTYLGIFNGNDGRSPESNLTLIGNTLYGTTVNGGLGNNGAVFSVPVGGGTPTVVGNFDGTAGEGPVGGVTLNSDGTTFYGTAFLGGAPFNNLGAIYSVPMPEPGSLALLVTGLGAVAVRRRRAAV